jgi:hypothetical protein
MPQSEKPPTAPAAAQSLPAFTPVPRTRDRHNGWKPEVQLAFIEALAETGSVRSAAARVDRAEVGAYLLRRHPDAQKFRAAWDAALDIAMRRIEDVAMDRALHGVEVPMYAYGKLVGTRRVYNDRLLMFMLRNRAPERFAASGGANGGGGLRRGSGASRNNAVDQMQLARLKKRWRAEWEEQREAEQTHNSEEVIASLDAKLARMQRNYLAGMTAHTRKLYEAWKAAEAEDKAQGRSAYNEQLETQEWQEAEDAEWEPAGEAEEDSAPDEPAAAGKPRALPRFLTQGDGETGMPRPTVRKRIQAALGAPEDGLD